MPSIVGPDGVTYQLPPDDSQAQKVPQYNAAIIALAAALSPSGAAWASWSPTWTNLSVGNGVVIAKYSRIGKLVTCRFSLVFGSTSSVSGDIQFTLPVTSVSDATTCKPVYGFSRAWDNSATTRFIGTIAYIDTTHAAVRFTNASATYLTDAVGSSTVPFTWAVSDEIVGQFSYEAA